MKKFLAKVSAYLAFCIVLMVAIPAIIDPYNVFHPLSARNNGIEPNKNYVKMTYILKNPDKYDAFLFGSSRVGAIHTEKIENLNCYNMTYSMGAPAEALANIQTMVDNGICPKVIYLGVDNLSYTVDPESHNNDASTASYEYLKSDIQNFVNHYCNIFTTIKSLSVIMSGEKTPGVAEIYEYGWWADYDYESSYDWSNEGITKGPVNRIDETLDEIRQIKEICDANDIEFIVFTNPMTYMTYEDSIDNGYEDFLEGLAEITDYIDFSEFNGTKDDHSGFVDNSHYSAQVGDMMIEILNNYR